MCGIFGFSSSKDNEINKLLGMFKKLQHRGKDGFGYVYKSGYIRKLGLIQDENEEMTREFIAHTRYSTSGKSTNINELHPIKKNDLYIVHNGNIPNFASNHDTTKLLEMCDEKNIEKSLINILNTIPASYCFLLYTSEGIYIVRDRYGIRPLCYKKEGDDLYISSESCVFENTENICFIKPGTIHHVKDGNIELVYEHDRTMNALCAFEIFYLMNPKSLIENKKIYDIRKDLGKLLSINDNFDKSYKVVGVPKSGLAAAYGYSLISKLEMIDAIELISEDRSFLTTNEERRLCCHKKFKYNKQLIKDQKIILIDDTIVRGTVLYEIVKNLKQYGAKEIHVRIPAPPIIDTCIYGISIRNKNELLMNNYKQSEIVKNYNLTSLKYLSIDDLKLIPNFPKQSYMKPFGKMFLNNT